MSEEIELTNDLAELQSQLSGLSPTSHVDHDALLYRAGWEAGLAQRANVSSRSVIPKTLATTFAALSAVLALMLFQASPQTETKVRDSLAKDVPVPKMAKTARVDIVQSVGDETSQSYFSNTWPLPSNRPVLAGRRDPEQWLRATDRMTVAASTMTPLDSPKTLRELYQELPLSTGDQL